MKLLSIPWEKWQANMSDFVKLYLSCVKRKTDFIFVIQKGG